MGKYGLLGEKLGHSYSRLLHGLLGDPGYALMPTPPGELDALLRGRDFDGLNVTIPYKQAVLPYCAQLGTTARAIGSVNTLWMGNAVRDGGLLYTGSGNDRDAILTAVGGTTPNNTIGPVYDRRDVNLDATIKYTGASNDRDIILANIGGAMPTNTRPQQLP